MASFEVTPGGIDYITKLLQDSSGLFVTTYGFSPYGGVIEIGADYLADIQYRREVNFLGPDTIKYDVIKDFSPATILISNSQDFDEAGKEYNNLSIVHKLPNVLFASDVSSLLGNMYKGDQYSISFESILMGDVPP